jgi:cholesterol transport system auxiliary component
MLRNLLSLTHCKNSLIMFSSFCLISCSALSPLPTSHSTAYVLSPNVTVHKTAQPRPSILYVSPVESDPLYDTAEMAYSERPYEIAYFAKNRWAEPPARLLQPIIVSMLQKSNYFKFITPYQLTGPRVYQLRTRLIKLQQIFHQQHSNLHLIASAQIINTVTGEIIISQQFDVVEPAAANPQGGVIATNLAVGKLLKKILTLCQSVL